MNELGHYLMSLIRAEGPITIAQYMSEVLINPRMGYYMRKDPLGLEGDFITAPEISQVFGELIGLWCANCWDLSNSPAPLRLVELGPGRGTLMADVWRACAIQPGFHAAADIHLVEVSPILRARQRKLLKESAPGTEVTWHKHFTSVPGGPLILIANEFFDALPIHQYERTLNGWRERMIDLDPTQGGFRIILSGNIVDSSSVIPSTLYDAPLGSVIEISPASEGLIREIADRIVRYGGAAIVIDYGRTESSPRNTLQAVRRHASHSFLEEPGTADLCAHVDFSVLAHAARSSNARVYPAIGQGAFLTALGIKERTDRLVSLAQVDQRRSLEQGAVRLINSAEMGALFKVLVITHPDLPQPAAVEA